MKKAVAMLFFGILLIVASFSANQQNEYFRSRIIGYQGIDQRVSELNAMKAKTKPSFIEEANAKNLKQLQVEKAELTSRISNYETFSIFSFIFGSVFLLSSGIKIIQNSNEKTIKNFVLVANSALMASSFWIYIEVGRVFLTIMLASVSITNAITIIKNTGNQELLTWAIYSTNACAIMSGYWVVEETRHQEIGVAISLIAVINLIYRYKINRIKPIDSDKEIKTI